MKINIRTLKKIARTSLYAFRTSYLCSVLAGVFLFTNVVSVYSVEQNFWAQRRKAVARIKQDHSQLNPSLPVNSYQDSKNLLAQLPKASPFQFGGQPQHPKEFL